MRRILAFLLALFLFSTFTFPVLAAQQEEPAIDPQMVMHLNSVHLSIDSWGVATCEATAVSDLDHTIQVVGMLQKWNGSSWGIIRTWTATDTVCVGLHGEYAVPKGYYYRFYARFYVYDANGELLEVVSNYKTVYY